MKSAAVVTGITRHTFTKQATCKPYMYTNYRNALASKLDRIRNLENSGYGIPRAKHTGIDLSAIFCYMVAGAALVAMIVAFN